MPEAGQHTPISDEEAEDWARRMIRDAEELDTLWDADEWEEFVFNKLGIERGHYASPPQRAVLATGRSYLAGGLIQAGYTTAVVEPYPGKFQTVIRDPLGRFASWQEAQVAIVPFRPF